MERQPNTQYILSLSYGKDSLACLEAIKQLGYPLDRIIHAEVWATDTIPADLPLMVEFKKYADKIIEEKYGIKVEHVCAVRGGKKLTYESLFYHILKRRKNQEREPRIYGFPGLAKMKAQWCTGELKIDIFTRVNAQCGKKNIVQYLGIAADESERIKRHSVPGKVLPLVDIGWNEAYCREWCEENDLLSPIYTTAARGGCWFCHNQSIGQLRLLRKTYPDLWQLLLKWDTDSPVTFRPDGHTVHDFDMRFMYEDFGIVPSDRKFRWKMITNKQSEWLNKILE